MYDTFSDGNQIYDLYIYRALYNTGNVNHREFESILYRRSTASLVETTYVLNLINDISKVILLWGYFVNDIQGCVIFTKLVKY